MEIEYSVMVTLKFYSSALALNFDYISAPKVDYNLLYLIKLCIFVDFRDFFNGIHKLDNILNTDLLKLHRKSGTAYIEGNYIIQLVDTINKSIEI